MFGTSAFAAAPFAALAGAGTIYDSTVEEAVTASDTAVNAVPIFAPLILEEIAVGENIVVAESDFSAAIAETITALDTGHRTQETEDRTQDTGDRRQETGDKGRRQETGGRTQDAGGRRQAARHEVARGAGALARVGAC